MIEGGPRIDDSLHGGLEPAFTRERDNCGTATSVIAFPAHCATRAFLLQSSTLATQSEERRGNTAVKES